MSIKLMCMNLTMENGVAELPAIYIAAARRGVPMITTASDCMITRRSPERSTSEFRLTIF